MELLPLWFVPAGISLVLLVIALYFKVFLKGQRLLAEVAIALVVVGLPILFSAGLPPIATALLAVFSSWQLLLAFRLMFGRLDLAFLQASTIYNSTILAALFIVVLLWTWFLAPVGLEFAALATMSISCLIGLVFVAQAARTYGRYRVAKTQVTFDLSKLPTVSLCIPARNEDGKLQNCLQKAVASDYPKLEILVLDDCSQDKTSEAIRAFANNGVRFVKGSAPADGWLGRNQAMSTLAKHATGELIIFMSVDTHISSHTISALVAYARDSADMVSVLPHMRQEFSFGTVFNTLRYFWQLVIPMSKWHIPVSSKLWLISRRALRQLGGFESVKHKIIPEESFARRLNQTNTYRFVVANLTLGASSAKTWNDHVLSALRLLYPTLKRQPVYVLATILGLLLICVLPFGLLVVLGLTGGVGVLFGLASLASVIWSVCYALVASRLQPASWLFNTLLLPAIFLQEAVLTVVSMLAYEFSEVNWKGRNVCYPVISKGRRSLAAASELGQKQHG